MHRTSTGSGRSYARVCGSGVRHDLICAYQIGNSLLWDEMVKADTHEGMVGRAHGRR